MLEGLAAWILHKYVGEYVENLNTDQLSIGLLQGKVELENLPLKKDALRDVFFPLEIKAGFLGKVCLQIPLTRLRSEPWVITIEKLYVVIGPVSLNEYDEDREDQAVQNRKLSRLDSMEAKWKAEHESKQEPSYYAYSYTSWLTYGSSIVTNILKKLQLKIKDVHIRYEDSTTDASIPFALGVVIHDLSSQSVDAEKEEELSSKESSETVQKLLELNGWAIYWDNDAVMLGGLDMQAMAESMHNHLNSYTTTQGTTLPHTYILSSVNAQAQISRNCSMYPLRSRGSPRLNCNLQVDKFPLSLSEVQYKLLVEATKEVQRLGFACKYRKWRPCVPVKGNAKLWWQFALQANIVPIKKQHEQETWQFVLQRARDLKSYIDVYYIHLSRPEGLTTAMKAEKDRLEQCLEFETLCLLREVTMYKFQKEQTDWSSPSNGQSMLQRWFPGWSGWYSSGANHSEKLDEEIKLTYEDSEEDTVSMSTDFTSQIEEEILGALDIGDEDTFLKRDTIFARVNFTLNQGTFTLSESKAVSSEVGCTEQTTPFLELKFSNVKLNVETRPRNKSLLFSVKLGGLFLQDCSLTDPLWRNLIAPHSNEPMYKFPKVSSTEFLRAKSGLLKFSPFTSPSLATQIPILPLEKSDSFSSTPLFELTYERKPFGSSADHRLVVNTQSLDVVWNPDTVHSVKRFFSSPGVRLSAAARSKYEEFKHQTKEDLKQKWDKILEGEEQFMQTTRWDIEMNISAPQLIVPENLQNKNSRVFILDLGKVQFLNSSSRHQIAQPKKDNEDDSDADEDFKTPCSTPPEDFLIKEEDEENVSANREPFFLSPRSSITEVNIRDRMYERYTLNLQDMQVLVGSVRESWKYAQLKGTSHMHVVDRFTISIQMERRLISTSDPQWPCVTLSGKLPKLVLHVNEEKVQAVETFLMKLEQFKSSQPDSAGENLESPDLLYGNKQFTTEEASQQASKCDEGSRELAEESVLLISQFCIEQMSLEVQSRGRCVAELQVNGVQANFSMRPLDVSVTLCVHGLLLVDALQTYGPDFELLVASHKHVSMDSRSGSLRDSEPNSPTSPASPIQQQMGSYIAPPSVLSVALSSIHSSPPRILHEKQTKASESVETDALITIELTLVNAPSVDPEKTNEKMLLAVVQFNNLDVIANQETIIELLSFVQRIKFTEVQMTKPVVPERLNSTLEMKLGEPERKQDRGNQIKNIELTFDFHQFNVLLLRAVSRKGSVSGQKVATATVSGARIQASLGSTLKIQGTLGGLQVVDLITERTRHRRIVSVGHDPHISNPSDLVNRLHSELYKPVVDNDLDDDTQKALTFSITRYNPDASESTFDISSSEISFKKDDDLENLDVVVRMASVCYTHSPRLLHELTSCATEFKEYMSALAHSIKTAATEVALGIVSKRTADVALGSTKTIGEDTMKEEIDEFSFNIKIDVLLQTPVIVLPSSASSSDVLVAHLGRITIQNVDSAVLQSPQFSLNTCDPFKADLIFVEFRDMNLYSLSIDKNLRASPAVGLCSSSPDLLSVNDLYTCSRNGQPILHETVIEFTFKHCRMPRIINLKDWFDESFVTDNDVSDYGMQQQTTRTKVEVTGTVVTPLNVVLKKQQYEQIIHSLDYITYCEDDTCEDLTDSTLTIEERMSSSIGPPQERPLETENEETSHSNDPLGLYVNFILPEFNVNLCGDLCEGDQGLVTLSFKEFVVTYEKETQFETNIQVTLKGLLMEDLLESSLSNNRFLIRSSVFESNASDTPSCPPKSEFISTSCPDMTSHMPLITSHPSLPDRLYTQNAFMMHLRKNRPPTVQQKGYKQMGISHSNYPFTPPPSPSGQYTSRKSREDTLVHISICLVDKRSPNFQDKHQQINRLINVDFNSLETTVNSQTWVMVLDFLGIGSQASDFQQMRHDSTTKDVLLIVEEGPSETSNSEIVINVRSLTLVLNKPSYELARANISNFSCHVTLHDGNTAVQGRLGGISVLDLTPYGKLYREKFLTAGKEALHFDIFKYGTPDLSLTREYDMKVKCQMSSVWFIHTNRFVTETMDFFQDFNQLQIFMSRIRAAAAGELIDSEIMRSPRIKLNITAGSPVIVVPQCYNSKDVLVANLGKLTVSSNFLFAGDENTVSNIQRNSYDNSTARPDLASSDDDGNTGVLVDLSPVTDERCLLQVMYIELQDMDLYSGKHSVKKDLETFEGETATSEVESLEFLTFDIQRSDGQLLKQKFMLKLQVEKNLHSELNHSVPDWTVHGSFSSVHFTLDPVQCNLIQGILSRNLGEKVETVSSTQINLSDTGDQTVLSGKIWTMLAIHMDLVNVTLELVHSHPRPDCANSEAALTKIDFIKSRLSLESYSDFGKDVDLVSHEIRVSDTRYRNAPVNNRPNVFTNILQPTKHASQESVLQVEVHYRTTRNCARLTVLLNNMRVMGIVEWIREVLQYFSSSTQPFTSADNYVVLSSTTQLESTLPSYKKDPLPKAEKDVPFELKVNMTDTELVVVEDPASWDTNAVILKSTAVLTYNGNSKRKPLSCSLQNLEVFSCILGVEDETALSIVDPVTVYIEVMQKEKQNSSEISDKPQILEISMVNLNLRLSYHDVRMFLRILDSLPKQSGIQEPSKTSEVFFTEEAVFTLQTMGFSRKDCIASLENCSGNLEEAAIWLTQNAIVQPNGKTVFNISAVEFKVSYLCLCLIDDCKDADVPLLELSLKDTYMKQLTGQYKGEANFIFGIDYYNRALSGWEPVVEPWRCCLQWNALMELRKLQKLFFKLDADDTLNLNVTSAFLDLYTRVKEAWTEDYYKHPQKDRLDGTKDSEMTFKRRSPFIPFALKNDTGCKLSFATWVSTTYSHEEQLLTNLEWISAFPGQVVPFSFEGQGKLRHRDSHKLRIHQLVLRIEGFHQLSPVSVDKVGVFFRYTKSLGGTAPSYTSSGVPVTRVVFDVTLEGNARKLVIVRSALLIQNKIQETVDLSLEKDFSYHEVNRQQLCLLPNSTVAVPLTFVQAKIWAKPADRAVAFSDNPLCWQHITPEAQVGGYPRTCRSIVDSHSVFRFSVKVKRENYPKTETFGPGNRLSILSKDQVLKIPAHTITLYPPVSIYNLLPYDLHFVLKDSGAKHFIKPGKNMPIHHVNTEKILIINFSLENFHQYSDLVIHPNPSNFTSKLEFRDAHSRLIVIQAKGTVLPGGALKLYLSAPYWIINRTGLPLIFRQEGTNLEAAGQFEEHEKARSVAPLLFSFSDVEAPAMCSMRVGNFLHEDGRALWCTYFHLEKGIQVRRLRVAPSDSRPDWVYTIGVEVKPGRGLYQDTHYVILSPRFLLDNRSSCKLEFAQKFAVKERQDQSRQYRHYISSAMPNSSLPFHWPRVDLDNLLCVRLADPGVNCLWSGGFRIDVISSFHIHMRDILGKSYFLRAEVITVRATFFVIFTEGDKIPPPMRIDNQSEVQVTFHQTGISEVSLKGIVRQHSSVPYAWDEPTYNPYITVTAPGGTSETYDMTSFREGKPLFYENFFYIAFTGTFLQPRTTRQPYSKSSEYVKSQELVLDVLQGTKVVINKKEQGKRSQLWRMTSTGMLQHEGSSPPRDLRQPADVYTSQSLVLDIAGIGPEPKEYTVLTLKKPDERRKLTQTWHFTSEGRLRCEIPNMFAQAKEGVSGLNRGNDVVLGPPQPVTYIMVDNNIPIEQAISTQKMRAGSGMLTVKVLPDGPTIVLRITDFRQRGLQTKTSQTSEWVVVEERYRSGYEPPAREPEGNSAELQLQMHLGGGIGISVVNHLSEELLYAIFHNIVVDFSQNSSGQSFDASIKNVQIDNQLRNADRSVILYITPQHKKDSQRHLPAVRITANKMFLRGMNAEIFRHLIVEIKNITLVLEELLMLKVLQLLQLNQNSGDEFEDEGMDSQLQRAQAVASVSAKRYYFSTLKLSLDQVKLSVLTTSQKPAELRALKKNVGWRLIQFEDAQVELDPFVKSHPLETMDFLISSVVEHYKEELQSQAAMILGAVDFLGNPLGLINDVSTGLSEFFHEGDTIGLIKSVAHGLSNSAAKVTGSLSDSLKNVTMDDRQQEERKRMLHNTTSGSEHLMAGLKGLGFGLLGGVTGIITHTYHGATNEGVPGFISGFGKGLLGAVAMPAVGVLDFASGAASAVRDTSRPRSYNHPNRCRPPRLCTGPGGLLPCYSTTQSLGHQFLYSLSNSNDELFVAIEQLDTSSEDMRALISTERVLILRKGSPTLENVIHAIHYSNLHSCFCDMSYGGLYYVNFLFKAESPSSSRHTGPLRIRCSSEAVAQKVVQEVNYAKYSYEERSFTVILSDAEDEEV